MKVGNWKINLSFTFKQLPDENTVFNASDISTVNLYWNCVF